MNGQEKVDEVAEGHYTAEYWEYDSRLGRRWNQDPKPNVSISNYACFANNPIWFNDAEGDTIRWKDKKNRVLMLLDDGKKELVEKHTQQEDKKGVYDMGIQWWEPGAKNYMKPLYVNPDIDKLDGIPHFTWTQVADFAMKDRDAVDFRTGGKGDWKKSPEGANGSILVTVGGKPYWADAIGQIPYAINTFKQMRLMGSEDNAITRTLATGMIHGDGCVFCTSMNGDYTNSYDNNMILRAALWANSKYKPVVNKVLNYKGRILTTYKLQITSFPASNLGVPITGEQRKKFINPLLKN